MTVLSEWELPRPEEHRRWWVRDQLHSSEPRTPLAATVCNEAWNEVALWMAEYLSVPDTHGLAVRTVNGYTYLSPLTVTDPDELAARTARFGAALTGIFATIDQLVAEIRAEQEGEMSFWGGTDIEQTTLMQLLLLWRRASATYRLFLQLHFQIVVPRHIVTRMLTQAAKELAGVVGSGAIGRLTKSLGRTSQLELDDELWGLAGAAVDAGLANVFSDRSEDALIDALRADPRAASWLEDLDRFLAVNGARSAYQLEIGLPSWREDPTPVLATLRGYVARGGRFDFAAMLEESTVERDAFLEEILELIAAEDDRVRFRETARRARILQAAMEDDNTYFSWSGVQLRAVALEIGRRLHSVGVLEDPEDVFYLERVELDPVVTDAQSGIYDQSAIRSRVAERRALRETQAACEPPAWIGPLPGEVDDFLLNEFWGITGRDALERADRGEGLLRGLPASPGAVEGTARVVWGPADFGRVREGDVLVCPSTNPVWSPLFSQISAIVTDQGGTLCHAAIVAREYGIPAVLGTHAGTRNIADGARVRVDGAAGTVEVLR